MSNSKDDVYIESPETWSKVLSRISYSRHKLTVEEEQYIQKPVNKYKYVR